MPTYLIFKRTGPGELDLGSPLAVIRGKSADEADDAIKEGAVEGAGDYVALSVSGKVERRVSLEPTVGEVPEDDEKPPETFPSPEPEEKPPPPDPEPEEG